MNRNNIQANPVLKIPITAANAKNISNIIPKVMKVDYYSKPALLRQDGAKRNSRSKADSPKSPNRYYAQQWISPIQFHDLGRTAPNDNSACHNRLKYRNQLD